MRLPVILFVVPCLTSGGQAVAQDLGVSDAAAGEYDWAFQGENGKAFKEVVEWAARTVDIDPGLLGASLISETRRDVYLGTRTVSSFTIGVDDYYEKRADIARLVPASADVSWSPGGTDTNENGRQVVSINFRDGRMATLASAVYLKHGEQVLRARATELDGRFDQLPLETRFGLVRLAFNAGLARAKLNLADALNGKDVLIRKGAEKPPWGPQRAATVLTARALKLSKEVFGTTGQ